MMEALKPFGFRAFIVGGLFTDCLNQTAECPATPDAWIGEQEMALNYIR